jgi:hypothetical protein
MRPGGAEGRRAQHYRLDMFPNRALTSRRVRRSTGALARCVKGGDMTDQPLRARPATSQARPRAGGSIACILFVGALAAAFWMGTIWASQAWLN